MQLDQVNNEDHTWWVGSMVQLRDGADAWGRQELTHDVEKHYGLLL